MSDTSTTTVITDISEKPINDTLTYDTSEVSKILGVQESTIRKYCTLMRKHHYEFNKNTVGHRIFFAKDIEVIKKITVLKNTSSLTLEQAVKTILNTDIDDTIDIEPISNNDYSQLLHHFEQFKTEQIQFNQKLLEQLEQQQNYIKHSIDERDRQLLHSIKESMEIRRQLTATIAEIEKTNTTSKKAWWMFWK